MANMSYQNPIGKIPDPFGYRVEGSQKQQHGGALPPEEPPEKKGLLSHLIQGIQNAISKMIDSFSGSSQKKIIKQKNLLALKASLDTLKIEDRSQDVIFLNELSQSWNRSLEISLEFEEKVSAIFKLFVKKINHYPENQHHTLGYYFTEYAGQKWVPFPYMELIQKIHREHELNPTGSALTEWTRLLDDTLRLLNGDNLH